MQGNKKLYKTAVEWTFKGIEKHMGRYKKLS
jgi:hypothetical protein